MTPNNEELHEISESGDDYTENRIVSLGFKKDKDCLTETLVTQTSPGQEKSFSSYLGGQNEFN